MTDTMEKKEALEQELDVQPAEVPAENPATETALEAASEAEPEAAPEDADRDENPADDAEFSRPADVSDDGSPHGPLDFFGGEDSEKKDAEEEALPSYAAFHEPDGRKPGEFDPEDEEEDYLHRDHEVPEQK